MSLLAPSQNSVLKKARMNSRIVAAKDRGLESEVLIEEGMMSLVYGREEIKF